MEFDIQLSQILPAMGYRTLFIEPNVAGKVLSPGVNTASLLENAFWQIDLNDDGTLRLRDKETGLVYDRVLEIEESSDDGDEYDYSPSREEWRLTSTQGEHEFEVTHEGWQSRAVIRHRIAVPANLAERAARQRNGYLDAEFEITLSHNSRRIDVAVRLDNQANDHRVRVLIPTPFMTEEVLADTQFGSITRPVQDAAMENWREEGWKEAPVPVWNLLNYAVLQEKRNGLALFTEGLREFEVVGDEQKAFALTLLRGVGVLGKEDLLLRPGRPSGIKMPVPDSQVRGPLSCRFSLFSFSGSPENAGVAQQAQSWLTPVQCYNKIPWDAMKLNRASLTTPESYSLLALSPTGCVLSAIKKAEDRDELILRLFNPSQSRACDATLAVNPGVKRCCETDMNERLKDHGEDEGIVGAFKPGQSRTFSLLLA